MTDDDAPHSERHSGAPITDREIKALAAEAEAGYDVDRLIARRRKRGTTLSEVIREALRRVRAVWERLVA